MPVTKHTLTVSDHLTICKTMHQSPAPPERGTPPSSLTRSLHLKRPPQSGSQFAVSRGPYHETYHRSARHISRGSTTFPRICLVVDHSKWCPSMFITCWCHTNYHCHHQPADASGFGARPLLTPQYFCPRSNLVEVPHDRMWSTRETCHLKISELHICIYLYSLI